MIVYRDRTSWIDPREGYSRLGALARGDPEALVDGLIAAGQLESGVVDAWCPDGDDLDPRIAPLRSATLAFARALVACWRGESAQARLLPVDASPLPSRIRISTPEGFAWYALYPEAYAEAASALADRVGPDRATVIGLRTIGASLAAVVHAALEARGWQVTSATVRPRGHPFDRRVRLGPALASAIRAPWVLVVDEGPGLSGSSLCGAAAAIAALGVPDRSILLVPAWCPDGSALRSEAARARWGRHQKLPVDSGAVVDRLARGEDWSGGAWRREIGAWPAVHPQHERVKRRDGDRVARFSGLGASGREAVERARRLAEAGIGPPVLEARRGFVVHPRLAGRALDRRDLDLLVPAVIRRLAAAREQPMAPGTPFHGLEEMIETNLAEAGLPVPRLSRWRSIADGGAFAIDGRMAAHEWIATPSGVVKTDGADHCDDHFLPGPQDLAWDLAGASIELGPAVRDAALDALGDRGLSARTPFYEVAYAALRVGYAALAHQTLSGDERSRWGIELARLRRAARRAAEALPR